MSSLPCLFCGVDASASTSESHIIPEAIGNSRAARGIDALILPPGWTCDRCNQRFGSKVEANFVNNDFGALARFKGVPSKGGRHPTWQVPGGATASVNGDPPQPLRTLRMYPTDTSRHQGSSDRVATAKIDMKVRFRPKHHLASALLSKLVVEFTAHLLGREVALAAAFDHHRRNALQPSPAAFLPYFRGPSPRHGVFHLELHPTMNYLAFDVELARLAIALDPGVPCGVEGAERMIRYSPGTEEGTPFSVAVESMDEPEPGGHGA